MGVPLVEVLMSTYNGGRFLHQQIDSILSQEDVDVRLRVRDDGSTDGTLGVLAQYSSDPRLVVNVGNNLGLPRAFFQLIQESCAAADYWALADQDDVWLPAKLSRGVRALCDVEGPGLYCARVLVVDETEQPMYLHPVPRRGPAFANALVQNIATGCTIVLNSAARALVVDRWPDFAVMHDAWLYLVVSGAGRVVYDDEVVVHYRQHSSNAVGMGSGPLSRVLGRARRQLSPEGTRAHGRQNACLAVTHADLLHPSAALQLEHFLSSRRTLWGRLEYAARGAAQRQTAGSDLVLKGLHLLDRV